MPKKPRFLSSLLYRSCLSSRLTPSRVPFTVYEPNSFRPDPRLHPVVVKSRPNLRKQETLFIKPPSPPEPGGKAVSKSFPEFFKKRASFYRLRWAIEHQSITGRHFLSPVTQSRNGSPHKIRGENVTDHCGNLKARVRTDAGSKIKGSLRLNGWAH